MKKFHLKYFIGFACLQYFFVFSQKNENTLVTNSQIRELITKDKPICSVPLSVSNTYSGKVDKVVNITSADEINVENNQNTHLNVGFVNSLTTNVFFPEKTEALIVKKLESILNLKMDSIINAKVQIHLDEKIKVWSLKLESFGNAVEKLQDNDPNKIVAFNELKKYKENILTTTCLNEDYGSQAITEIDSNGNKTYSFDLEKIKNDPNYFFIGDEVNGFRIIRKRNKYGYLNTIDNLIEKVKFKYDYAENYHSSGFAAAGDDEYVYLIDKYGKEKQAFYKKNNTSLTIINENRFLITRDNESFLVDQNGKDIIYSNKIEPTDFSFNYFYVLDSISVKQLDNIKYGFPIVEGQQHIKKIEVLEYLKSNTKALLNLHICNLNGENVSKKYENDKKITSLYNCAPRNNSLNKNNSLDYLVLINAINIPNSEYLFLYFVKAKEQTSHYVILDSKSKIVHYSSLSSTNKNLLSSLYFFPIGSLTDDNNTTKIGDLILGCQLTNFFKLENEKKVYTSITPFYKENLKEFELDNKVYILNLYQQRFIGGESKIGFEQILGSINQSKTIIVSKKDKDGKVLYGAIDYNGLYIVPPIMQQMEFKKDGGFYGVKTNKDDSIYELSSLGNCTSGDCKKYNQIIREYFENESKN